MSHHVVGVELAEIEIEDLDEEGGPRRRAAHGEGPVKGLPRGKPAARRVRADRADGDDDHPFVAHDRVARVEWDADVEERSRVEQDLVVTSGARETTMSTSKIVNISTSTYPGPMKRVRARASRGPGRP